MTGSLAASALRRTNRVWQGALGCVDEQHHTVDHGQTALDLATEIGVTGGVDDVDGDAVGVAGLVGCGTLEPHRGVLGEDGDALLTFEVTGVHRALFDVLMRTERAGLPEHGVNERGLSVVYVGDDGNVADVTAVLHGHGAILSAIGEHVDHARSGLPRRAHQGLEPPDDREVRGQPRDGIQLGLGEQAQTVMVLERTRLANSDPRQPHQHDVAVAERPCTGQWARQDGADLDVHTELLSSASSGSSPASTLPPGSSQPPASSGGSVRRALSRVVGRSRSSTIAAPTTSWGTGVYGRS